uniref:Fuseless n=1 Tax=Glossina brevipalpis TaxID=37001 RepID=A0A1A9WUD2_9MUSC
MVLTSDASQDNSVTTPCLVGCQTISIYPAAAAAATTPKSTTTAATITAKETIKKSQRNLHDLLLEISDVLLSCILIAPCVIAYWRGTWELVGVILFPKNAPLSALCSFLIGGIGHLSFTLFQRLLTDNIHPDKHRLTYYVISRCYTYVFGVVCVNMWRGAWVLCDWLTSADSLIIICVVTLVALLFLIATRTVRNLGAAPYSVIMDHKSDYFQVETMFRIPSFRQPGLYLMDALFSIFVIGTLVVIAWRGLWGVMDLTLYPHDKVKSARGSLVKVPMMGCITVTLTYILHPIIRWMCDHIDGICKLIICDIYYLAEFYGAVNTWRGIWNLLDVYVYPDNLILSYCVTHIVPFLLLAALKCSNSILVRGVYIDAEGEGSDSVNIPINYIKLHFQRERDKRLKVMFLHKPNLLIHNNEKEAHCTLNEKKPKNENKPQSDAMDANRQIV